jgi:hypothetical protein
VLSLEGSLFSCWLVLSSAFLQIIIGRVRRLTEGFLGLCWRLFLSIYSWCFIFEELCAFIGDIFSFL